MMKLFYLKGSCSLTPHVALEWIGQPYEAVEASREYIKSEEYIKLNSQGAVPLLIDGNFSLSQNAAILYYLDQRFPNAKLFGDGDTKEKAQLMRWLSFLNSDLHKAFVPLFRQPEGLDKAGQEVLKQQARTNIRRMLGQAETHLDGRQFMGTEITVVDLYLYVMLRWARGHQLDLSDLPNLNAFYDRVGANAGVQAVLATEGLEP